MSVTFDYNPLWIAFRPTLWTFAIVLVGVVIVAVWTRPKTKVVAPRTRAIKVTPGLALSSDSVNEFADSYEEKNRITKEIRSLEARAQHGRIPRRRYKVQRKALEMRLDKLNQTIAQLREIMRKTGGTYADYVRQVETVEIELNEVEMNLKNIEIRHETGEISLETYRKQIAELDRRKKKAETAMDSLLLRLRGEMRISFYLNAFISLFCF